MNKSILGSTLTCGVLLLAMLSGCNNEAPSEPQPQVTATVSAQALTPAQASDLARDAWLFGMPLVMFEKQIDYSTYVTQAGGGPGTD